MENPNAYNDGLYVSALDELDDVMDEPLRMLWNAGGDEDSIRSEVKIVVDAFFARQETKGR